MMRSLILVTTLVMLVAPFAAAQTAPAVSPALRDSVMAPVHAVFSGMQSRDTALMRASFAPGAVLGGVPRPGEAPSFVPLDQFLGSIASAPPAMVLNEAIYDAEVRVDGGLATAWMFYTFAVGDKVSHCGFDAFQLVRTSGGWKIVAIADSRRTEGCDASGRRLELPPKL